jgi:hypothetical protein
MDDGADGWHVPGILESDGGRSAPDGAVLNGLVAGSMLLEVGGNAMEE